MDSLRRTRRREDVASGKRSPPAKRQRACSAVNFCQADDSGMQHRSVQVCPTWARERAGLSAAREADAMATSSVKERTEVSESGSRRARNFSMHLRLNLYASSEACRTAEEEARALQTLRTLRHWCRALPVAAFDKQASTVLEELRETEGCRVSLRTRISFARGVRLHSPNHDDASRALRDWKALTSAWGGSLFTGGVLRQDCSPEAAEIQWIRTCRAWQQVWINSGRRPRDLDRQLAAIEIKRKPRWVKAEKQWRLLQARTVHRVASLLAVRSQSSTVLTKAALGETSCDVPLECEHSQTARHKKRP